jgi:alcohol dehydrogenase (cytochrome c)
VAQNVVARIDGTTGEVFVNREATFSKLHEEKVICPGSVGGKNWPAGAYNPVTNTMYMPMQNLCMTATTIVDTRDPSKVYGIDMKPQLAPGADKVGSVWAISAATGETAWKYEQRAGMMSLVATGGGLVFGGDVNGRFKALDDRTGKVLWEINLGAPLSGYPITFSVGGKQYVAAITGPSLSAAQAARIAPELTPGTGAGVFVFALP